MCKLHFSWCWIWTGYRWHLINAEFIHTIIFRNDGNCELVILTYFFCFALCAVLIRMSCLCKKAQETFLNKHKNSFFNLKTIAKTQFQTSSSLFRSRAQFFDWSSPLTLIKRIFFVMCGAYLRAVVLLIIQHSVFYKHMSSRIGWTEGIGKVIKRQVNNVS